MQPFLFCICMQQYFAFKCVQWSALHFCMCSHVLGIYVFSHYFLQLCVCAAMSCICVCAAICLHLCVCMFCICVCSHQFFAFVHVQQFVLYLCLQLCMCSSFACMCSCPFFCIIAVLVCTFVQPSVVCVEPSVFCMCVQPCFGRHMSNVMKKPVYAICEQQRRRSACASAQSDSITPPTY